ncbi:MAG: HypC/HybG/HupF family hydrogenase formation chaperone [Candidatus Thiodiazotropha sp. (ex Epidulcina cf. delphinae)]|nr:HypC/HybG/HupF family hydrogenase formation chaperone [Candidatus Thiodiazotropha sp. (ex Epidulcina cf. delphinae)]
MCVGIPVQIINSGEFISLCRGRNGEEPINMMLTGPQPEGAWLLAFLGSAREVISEEDARNIDRALDGLSAIMNREEDFKVADYFPGLADS